MCRATIEEFNPGRTLDNSYNRVGREHRQFPAELVVTAYADGNILPNPRNNPVYNISNTLTWLKGRHTMTFGGMFRRTTMYESIGGNPPAITLGLGDGDPAANVISVGEHPRLCAQRTSPPRSRCTRCSWAASALQAGNYFLDEETLDYRLGPAFRREEQNVGGLFAQDQWRVSPQLTVNYGMRWEFSGAVANPNEVYSGPTVAGLYGPSTEVFQPGVLNGDLNPQIILRPKPYKGDFVNPAPNVGMAWNPDKPEGFLGTLLGKAVYRAQLRHQLLRRGVDPVPDRGRQRSGPAARRSRCRRSRRVR